MEVRGFLVSFLLVSLTCQLVCLPAFSKAQDVLPADRLTECEDTRCQPLTGLRFEFCRSFLCSRFPPSPTTSSFYACANKCHRKSGSEHIRLCLVACASQGDDEYSEPRVFSRENLDQVSSLDAAANWKKSCVDACAALVPEEDDGDRRACVERFCFKAEPETAAASTHVKRWGSRVCMDTQCRQFQSDVKNYVSCGLTHCG